LATEYLHHASSTRRTPEKKAQASEAASNLQGWEVAVEEIKEWPGYEPQPLWSLVAQAERLGVAKVWYKDESQRFGRELGSFKALGAPYAVFMLLGDEVEARTGHRPTADELRSGVYRAITERVTVCVATDGNQGRGLAYAAKVFGCRCVDYIHGHVSTGRKEAMEAYGAIVIRIDGEYEASVQRAKEDARMNGWYFVSSTSWNDFTEPLPRRVMNAYMVMVDETLAMLDRLDQITHVFMHGGVGSIAAAVFLGIAQALDDKELPRFVMVEPLEADCLYQSAVHGTPTPSAGTLRTIMAGLACREVSPAAWKILEWLCSDYLAIPDGWAVEGMKALADGGGDVPIVCGESAAGSMGVLLRVANDRDLRATLGLDENSQVLLFGCEGATDPKIYEEIVGIAAADVFGRQAQVKR
jgi:diaminopropionate ammonia-lyase